jgi:perosamine synthetase
VATLAPVLSSRTRAVIVVHQTGVPADLDEIRALCDEHGVQIIEDAACAIGSSYKGQPIGGHSDLVAFSFHPRKVITTGEGGMLMTSRQDFADRARRLREHGMSVSATERHASATPVMESYDEVGFNYRMTDIQAAVGLVQLDRLDAIVARRRALAERYTAALGDIPGVLHAADPEYGTTNYQSYWVLLPDDFPMGPADVLAELQTEGISGRRGIMASHLEPAYAGVRSVAMPNTEKLTRRSLLLPLYHDLSTAEQDAVIDAFHRAVRVAV